MFAVEVRDHIMIAHSFRGAVFGPAQALHGATFVIDACLHRRNARRNGIVVDIGRAHEALKAVLEPAELPQSRRRAGVQGLNTTTEFLTKHIFDQLAEAARGGQARPRGPRAEGDPRHHLGIACRARLVRGAVCGEARRVRGARRSCNADRRLRLRPAHDRGIAEARLAGRRGLVSAMAFRRPSAAHEGGRARRSSRRCRGHRPIVIDGLALGVLPEAAAAVCAKRIRWSRWCIIRWRWKPGLSADGCAMRCARASARRWLPRKRVIVTSAPTARLLVAGLRRGRPTASPSRGRAPIARPPRAQAAMASSRLLSVGALVPRKGFDVLIAALATLTDLPWRLTIAGDRTRNPAGRGAARCRHRAAQARRSRRRARRGVGRPHRRALRASPMCSCWPRASRATAWPMPRRWRTACR